MAGYCPPCKLVKKIIAPPPYYTGCKSTASLNFNLYRLYSHLFIKLTNTVMFYILMNRLL